ncbi:MAG TPA: hypothetical protein VHZ28_12470 [Terracidiphilus sp.]|jgi:hypothetical protein|nr:hypothetical protein [Terracidiphilus sp.]
MLYRLLLALVLFGLPLRALRAQSSDWGVIQSLPIGTQLAVTTQLTASCTLEQVTDEYLECESHFIHFHLARVHIRRVRLARPGKGTVIGAAIGSVLGGSVGAADRGNGYDTASRITIGTGFGILFGGAIGRFVGHYHGPTIYEAP